MWKKLCITIVVCFCAFAFYPMHVTADAEVIENDESGIPDHGLYLNILDELGKKKGEKFTKQEAESIQSMSIIHISKNYRVKTYQGIGFLKNLTMLSIISQKIDNGNLKEISLEVPQLESLQFNGNGIDSLKSIRDMKNLKYLQVQKNRLTSLEGIEELSNLTSLSITYGLLTDISALRNLTNLTYLNLSLNQLTNVCGLENLIHLTSLDLSRNRLTNIHGLENLVNLTDLYLSENRLTNIHGLENLVNLTDLFLSENKLKNVNELKHLIHLKWLYLDGNELKKLPNLKGFEKLEYVYITSNRLRKKELKKKLPEHLFENRFWVKRHVITQKQYFKIKLTSPKSKSKISEHTKKITGKIETKYASNKYSVSMLIMHQGKSRYKRAKLDKNGTFVLDRLNLEPFKGCEAEIFIYFMYFDPEDGDTVKRLTFTIQ